MNNYSKNYKKGFTLTELVIVMGIGSLIMLGIVRFERNVLFSNTYATDALQSAQDGRSILRTMIRELRTASIGNNGSFPIIQAATSTISFFSDSNADGLKEQIRYFVSSNTLIKGSITPTGSPLTYNPANEILTTLSYNVKNSTSTPLFYYYDNSYAGTSSPLTQPITVTNVHLVRIYLLVDVNPNKSPIPRAFESQVNLRNLKDNL